MFKDLDMTDDPHISPVVSRRKRAEHFVTAALRQHGMTMLVDGHAGMGKTFFLREIVDVADNGKTEIVFVRADEIESGEPFSFIERFVAGTSIYEWDFVPTKETSPIQVAREGIKRLTALSAEKPILMLFDDAQWIDQESQRVLRYLIPRVARRNIITVFGVRTPHKSDSFGEFLLKLVSEVPSGAHFAVQPLSLQEISALALDRLKVGISSQAAQLIYDETNGSFLSVDSILSSFTEAEAAELHVSWDPLTPLVVPDHDPLLYTFNELSDGAQRTAEIICLAGHEVNLDELKQVAKALDEPLHIDEGMKSGVLIKSGFGSNVMSRHALLAQAIAATITEPRRRAIHRALAAVTSGYRSLHHTLLGADEWDEDLHVAVNNFVAEAADKGNFQLASEVLRAALKTTKDSASRIYYLESLVLLHLRAKTGYLVLDLLPELEMLPESVLHDFMAIVLAAHQFGEELPQERVQKLLMTQAKTADDQTIVAFFSFMVVILTMRSANRDQIPMLIELSKGHVANGPDDAAELQDQRLAWMLDKPGHTLILDSYRMVHDQVTGKLDLVREALPALTERAFALADGPNKVDSCVALAGAEIAIGNVPAANKLAKLAVQLLGRVGEPWAASTARLILADSYLLLGKYKEATETIEMAEELTFSSLDVETRSTWAALRVFIGAVTGRGDVASYLEVAKRQKTFMWEGYGTDSTLIAECELAKTQGNFERVLEISDNPWISKISDTRNGVYTYRAHALIELGRLEEAASLTEQLQAWRGSKWQEYWGTLDWLLAKLAFAKGENKNADWFFKSAIAEKEYPLPLGLTLADYGAFLVSQGDHEKANKMFAESIKTLKQLDAKAYLDKIEESYLAVPGNRSANANTKTLLATLTPREMQIAEHLAKGRSNNQIAETLVISVTTVRSHVSNILRKLQLSSRGQVAKLFRES